MTSRSWWHQKSDKVGGIEMVGQVMAEPRSRRRRLAATGHVHGVHTGVARLAAVAKELLRWSRGGSRWSQGGWSGCKSIHGGRRQVGMLLTT